MKKTLLLLAMLCFTLVLNAQDDDDKDKKWPNGIRGGYQLSNLVGGDQGSFDNFGGFYVGYVRKVKLIPLLRLETGMEYMMAGAQKNGTTLRMNYIVLPAQIVLKLGPFFALAGVNANFDVYQSIETNGTKDKVTGDNKANTFDVAADGGVGFNFLFLAAEARYYWGLTDIKDGYKNQYLQLGLKLHF